MAKAKKLKRPPDSRDRLLKKQLAMYLEPEQADALKAVSVESGVPQQVIVRRGIDYMLTHDFAKHAKGYKPKVRK